MSERLSVYWWNIRGLKAQLGRGSLPQPIAFRYAAAYATLSAIAMVPGPGANPWDVLAYWRIGSHIRSVSEQRRVSGGAA